VIVLELLESALEKASEAAFFIVAQSRTFVPPLVRSKSG